MRLVAALAISLTALAWPPRLIGQAPSYDGLDTFANLAFAAKLEPIERLADLALHDPNETLIILLGDNRVLADLEWELAGLTPFLQRGGALLVATDRPDEGRLKDFGLSVNSESVSQPPENSLMGNSKLPVILRGHNSKHPLLVGLRDGLATNNPSFLRGQQTDLHLLASFQRDAYYGWRDRWFAQRLELEATHGYIWGSPGDAPPGGRRLILAGHGLFMNGMILENDNFEFTRRSLNWLAEGPQGRRRFALIVINGEVLTAFNLPLMPLPRLGGPSEPIINAMLDGMQKDRQIDRYLLERFGRDNLLRGVLLTVSLVLLFLGVRRVMQGRHRLDTSVPLLVGLQGHAALQPLLEQRHAALQEAQNYWEPAQVLIRQWFLEHGALAVPFWEGDAPPPPLVTAAPPRQAQRLRRLVHQLWQWATSPPQGSLSSRRFLAMMANLEELTQAKLAQQFRFAG